MCPTLDRAQPWLRGETEVFRAAMDGAPLATTLGILIRTAAKEAGDDQRCAFYIANREGTELAHVVGIAPRILMRNTASVCIFAPSRTNRHAQITTKFQAVSGGRDRD